MPTPTAGLLNSPLMTFSFLRNGASGSSVLLNSISAPAPLAHQCLLLMPLPMNSAAKRFGGVFAAGSAPQTGTDSSQGKAIVTPTPRRKVRREIWNRRFSFVLRIDFIVLRVRPALA